MKTSVAGVAALAAALVSGGLFGLLRSGDSAPKPRAGERAGTVAEPAATSAGPAAAVENDAQLSERLKALCSSAQGDVGITVIHVETGRTASVEGGKALPLYSVYKLPLAVVVLQDVKEKRLTLDQKVRITPDDVAPGSQFNADLWRRPVEKTVSELLEYSIVRSDNTSADKLLGLVGGPASVTQRLRTLGFAQLDIQYTSREFAQRRDKPNTGTASDLAKLLVKLQQGELVEQPHQTLLLEFMTRSRTGGERRLRADLPPGTPVSDKTGSGGPGGSTNDVGLITLPEGKGHLAVAVLVSGSKLPVPAQEKLIAQLARAAYDAFVAPPAK